jgi:hypothetical protein
LYFLLKPGCATDAVAQTFLVSPSRISKSAGLPPISRCGRFEHRRRIRLLLLAHANAQYPGETTWQFGELENVSPRCFSR